MVAPNGLDELDGAILDRGPRKVYRRGAAEAKAKEIGNGAVAIACDVADPASVMKAVDAALETLGEIDVLVNSGAVVFLAPAEALPLDHWDRTIVTHSPSTGVRRLLIRPAAL